MPMKSGQNSRHHQRARISHCISWIVFFEIINLFISHIVNYLFCADKPTSKQVHARCFYRAAESSTCLQVTYTSDRRQLQMHRAGAAGSRGCQPARAGGCCSVPLPKINPARMVALWAAGCTSALLSPERSSWQQISAEWLN